MKSNFSSRLEGVEDLTHVNENIFLSQSLSLFIYKIRFYFGFTLLKKRERKQKFSEISETKICLICHWQAAVLNQASWVKNNYCEYHLILSASASVALAECKRP